MTFPTVSFGTEKVNTYPLAFNVQEALNFPSEVTKPALANSRSPNCGAIFHVDPSGETTARPTTNSVNADVGPDDQPCARETYDGS